VWSVDNPFLVIIAVVTAVGLLATVLEASTILVEVQTIRDQFAESYNQALEDVTTHRSSSP
jgi:hypothetical protein